MKSLIFYLILYIINISIIFLIFLSFKKRESIKNKNKILILTSF